MEGKFTTNSMIRYCLLTSLLICFFTSTILAEDRLLSPESDLLTRQGLTDGLFGFSGALESSGIDVTISLTNIFQQNVRGGLSTSEKSNRFSGKYDVEFEFDTEKLFDIENGYIYMVIEGGYNDSIDDQVGSFFGVNELAYDQSPAITELWYQHGFMDHALSLRLGKMDISGGFESRGRPLTFDGNMYANDEYTQFLNPALVNNATIPFPENGLAAVIYYNPEDIWYVSAGVQDALGSDRQTGFNTTFHGEDYFFYIAETGFVSELDSARGKLLGCYRAGIWYDPQPKGHSDTNQTYRDDAGFYFSFDQEVYKENNDTEDTQGMGLFFRYGFAPRRTNDLNHFISAGLHYQGLFEGRDEDVFGLGFAHGIFSNKADVTFTENYESVLELYYNAEITPYFYLTPSVQYIKNPGGDRNIPNSTVIGARAQLFF